MSLSQIDETDGGYFYMLSKPLGDGKTLYVHFGEDDGVQLVYTMPDRALVDDPLLELMSWEELEQAGFVEL